MPPRPRLLASLRGASGGCGGTQATTWPARAARDRLALTGSWDALGELVDGLPAVRTAAKKVPYLNAFA